MNRVLSMLHRPFVRRSVAAVSALLVFTACQPQSSSASGAAAPQASAATPPVAGAPGVQGRMALPDFASLVQQHGAARTFTDTGADAALAFLDSEAALEDLRRGDSPADACALAELAALALLM